MNNQPIWGVFDQANEQWLLLSDGSLFHTPYKCVAIVQAEVSESIIQGATTRQLVARRIDSWVKEKYAYLDVALREWIAPQGK